MLICITNRHLCSEDLAVRLNKAIASGADAVILREKDLDESEYKALAMRCLKAIESSGVPLIIHSRLKVAKQLGIRHIHLPYELFLSNRNKLSGFVKIGVSVHSVEEAVESEKQGATYLIAGHIFETECKKNVSPRGLKFLESICRSVNIPVYAIGGIGRHNMDKVLGAGAQGGCMMSGFMA